MNDDLLKRAGGGNYFDELLARIRDIRSSEKVFYRKVLEIYALSIDYDPRVEMTQKFFKTVQNKMHYSVHGHTAAEIIYERANAEKDFMGLTTWSGAMPSKPEAEIAKNYLTHEEVKSLNRIVSLYLDFAEMQAEEHRPMYMKAGLIFSMTSSVSPEKTSSLMQAKSPPSSPKRKPTMNTTNSRNVPRTTSRL